MSLVELHPEDLIEREISGDLTPTEHQRLHDHLERCAVCRFERQARLDFEQELENESNNEDEFISSLVANAIQFAQPSPSQRVLPLAADLHAEPPSGQKNASLATGKNLALPADSSVKNDSQSADIPRAERSTGSNDSANDHQDKNKIAPVVTLRSKRLLFLAMIAAAVLLAGVATAAGWTAILAPLSLKWPASTTNAPLPSVPASAPKATLAAKSAQPAQKDSESPADSQSTRGGDTSSDSESSFRDSSAKLNDASPQPGVTNNAPSSQSVVVPMPAVTAPTLVVQDRHDSPVRTNDSSTGSNAGSAENTAPPVTASAATLFSQANEAKRTNNQAVATRLYQEIVAQYPQSPEANVARAQLGRMALQQGDAASALKRFDESLSQGSGALTEEVLVGKALSQERTGDKAGAIATWSKLVSLFPTSINAARAKARINALGQN